MFSDNVSKDKKSKLMLMRRATVSV